MASPATQTIELSSGLKDELSQPVLDAGSPAESPRKHQAMAKDSDRSPDLTGKSDETEPTTGSAAFAGEKWNNPKSNAYRLGAAFFSFLVLGANDAAYGVSAILLGHAGKPSR